MKHKHWTFYTTLHAAVILLGLAILICGLTSCKGFSAPGFTVFYETEKGTFETTYRPPNRVIQPSK